MDSPRSLCLLDFKVSAVPYTRSFSGAGSFAAATLLRGPGCGARGVIVQSVSHSPGDWLSVALSLPSLLCKVPVRGSEIPEVDAAPAPAFGCQRGCPLAFSGLQRQRDCSQAAERPDLVPRPPSRSVRSAKSRGNRRPRLASPYLSNDPDLERCTDVCRRPAFYLAKKGIKTTTTTTHCHYQRPK